MSVRGGFARTGAGALGVEAAGDADVLGELAASGAEAVGVAGREASCEVLPLAVIESALARAKAAASSGCTSPSPHPPRAAGSVGAAVGAALEGLTSGAGLRCGAAGGWGTEVGRAA